MEENLLPTFCLVLGREGEREGTEGVTGAFCGDNASICFLSSAISSTISLTSFNCWVRGTSTKCSLYQTCRHSNIPRNELNTH